LFVVIVFLLTKFVSQKQNSAFTLWLAIVMMANDMLANASQVGNVQKICLQFGGIGVWPTALGIVAKAVAGFCEHIFLIKRFYLMSKNLPLTIFLATVTTAHAACHLASAGMWFKSRVPLKMVGPGIHYEIHVAGWSLGVAVDTLVTAGIAWQLLRLDVVFKSTKGIVRKFLLTTVLSGGMTAICGVLLLILLKRTTYAYLVLACNFEKIYVITVFTNLAVAHAVLERPTTVTGGTTVPIRGLVPTWTTSVLAVINRSRVTESKPSAAL
jgi:hypothetical protein